MKARPLKILIWATTFGADIWALTKHLDSRSDIEVKVVMDQPEKFRAEPVARLFPLRCELVQRKWYQPLVGVDGWHADVTVLDNRVPWRRTSPKGFVLWHGFGWKGPNDRKEFALLHYQLRRAWGDPLRPNRNFRWQCFGPWDFTHRTQVSGFHPDNCRVLGSAIHDELRVPLDKAKVADLYPFDIRSRKTVLLAPTWHYGEVFAHWGKDEELLNKLISHIEARGANVILRLHDSFRFPRGYVALLERLATAHPHLLLKFKDRNPDNYVDMQIADVLLTNFSSIANLYYATQRPTVHIYPVADADEAFMWRRYTPLGVLSKSVENARFIWKLPPEDNGGLLARNFDELISSLDRALDDPRCCAQQVRAFLDRHMQGGGGHNCERILEAIRELADRS